MRRVLFFLVALCAAPFLLLSSAHAQTPVVVQCYNASNPIQPWTPCTTSGGALAVSGSFSATLAPFAPAGNFAHLTSTASSADSALPSGSPAVVALFNTGTSAVSCTFTVGAGTAAANENVIQASSWSGFAVGTNTHFSCINQAGDAASNVVVASGGTGLPAGAGGGGGSSAWSNSNKVIVWDGTNNLFTNTNAAYVQFPSAQSVSAAPSANGTWGLVAQNGATAPTNALVGGCTYNSGGQSLSNGNSGAVQCDSSNRVIVNVGAATGLSQGSTTSGQTGSLVMGAATTSPPSYTTAQTNPVSLDLNGGTRLSPACTGVINITQTSTTDVHTFTHYGYICSIMLVSASAQNIGIDEGTGTTCESSGTALVGVSSTSSATPTVAIAANGGFSMVSGVPLMKLQASADHLCILQSGSGNVSGTITYADLTN